MSKVSIYETRWIDLIFETRNKQYGAYQLRRETVKSSLNALFLGLLFVASLGGISTIIGYLKPEIITEIPVSEWKEPLVVTKVDLYEIEEKTAIPPIQSQVKEATIVKDQLVNPTIVHPTETTPEIATNAENKYVGDVISEGTGKTGINISSPGNESGTGTEIPKTVDYVNSLVNTAVLDKMPQFPGGIDKFYKYVGNNFEKPDMEASMTYKVFVSFVIEKDGSMTDIKVNRDPGYGLGKEAVRVLKSLRTKWTPGMVDSKPVRTAYSLPIVVEMR